MTTNTAPMFEGRCEKKKERLGIKFMEVGEVVVLPVEDEPYARTQASFYKRKYGLTYRVSINKRYDTVTVERIK